jgi:hypothetical protein
MSLCLCYLSSHPSAELDSTRFENDDARQDAETSAAIAQGKARLEMLTGRPRAVAAMLTTSYDNGGKGLDAAAVQVKPCPMDLRRTLAHTR